MGDPLMSFDEIILRIGASIGGWLIFLALCLTLAILPEADCDPASDELWRGTLFFALLAGLGLFFVSGGLAWSSALRWFALPAGGLALYAGYVVFPGLLSSTLGGASLCGIANPTVDSLAGIQATRLERALPIAQIVVLSAGIVQAIRYWNAPPRDPSTD